MTSLKSHRRLHGGAPRPFWAGAIQAVSRQRASGPGRVTHTLEFSGLVLPVSGLRVGQSHTFGQSLGFPHLGEQLPDMEPELWKNWGRLEQVLGAAAVGVMGWKGSQPPRQAARLGIPEKALHLRLAGGSVWSAGGENPKRLLRSDGISGEISKVFNITDVSGSQHRFESAGASATFRVTRGAVHWSRDPRSL